MRYAIIAVLNATLILSGCDRSQVNYGESNLENKWVFHNTGEEMVSSGLGTVVLIVLGVLAVFGSNDLDSSDDELSW